MVELIELRNSRGKSGEEIAETIIGELNSRELYDISLLYRGLTGGNDIVNQILNEGTDRSRKNWKRYANENFDSVIEQEFGRVEMLRLAILNSSPRYLFLAEEERLADTLIASYALGDKKGIISVYNNFGIESKESSLLGLFKCNDWKNSLRAVFTFD